jgi:hypothetical protein
MEMPRSGPKTEPTLSQFILNIGEFLKIRVLEKGNSNLRKLRKVKIQKNQNKKHQNPKKHKFQKNRIQKI